MLTTHRALGTWTKMVDVYVALTEFAQDKFIEGGLPAEKIVVKPNFVADDPGPGGGSDGYALFVGRLSPEKGIETMLAAWDRLRMGVPLKIVGDGPLRDLVIRAAARQPSVEWLGYKTVAEVHALMKRAGVLVFPSEWYETFGRVAVEAFAAGTPVIAANIGAVGELVEHGDAEDWRVPSDSPLESLLGDEQLRSRGALMAVDADGVLRGVVTIDQVRRALTAALPQRLA
jgi:glycosyltransferase involved in cell wall biosynthesis